MFETQLGKCSFKSIYLLNKSNMSLNFRLDLKMSQIINLSVFVSIRLTNPEYIYIVGILYKYTMIIVELVQV